MANRGAPEGNTNAAKGTRWRNAIESALKLRCKSDGQKALVNIAEQLLEKAENGDVSALRELGDRLDGKAAQAVNIGGQPDNPLVVEPARPKLEKEEWVKLHVIK